MTWVKLREDFNGKDVIFPKALEIVGNYLKRCIVPKAIRRMAGSLHKVMTLKVRKGKMLQTPL